MKTNKTTSAKTSLTEIEPLTLTFAEVLEDEEYEDTTVSAVIDSIETNLWQAEGYFRSGSEGVGVECLRAAWLEYVRFRDVLKVYLGAEADSLGDRLVSALVSKAGDAAATLALGADTESERIRRALLAA